MATCGWRVKRQNAITTVEFSLGASSYALFPLVRSCWNWPPRIVTLFYLPLCEIEANPDQRSKWHLRSEIVPPVVVVVVVKEIVFRL